MDDLLLQIKIFTYNDYAAVTLTHWGQVMHICVTTKAIR